MANSLSLLELFEELRRLTGRALAFERAPARVSDQRVFVADCRAARDAFAWAPRVGRAEGLRRMVEWVEETSRRPR
jgi:CDP-paratose 2-epimerase